MERASSSRVSASSCVDCLKLKLPWTTNNRSHYVKHKRTASICDSATSFYPHTHTTTTTRHRPRIGAFKYDALSYAQNFDDSAPLDEEYFSHGFSSRYAPGPGISVCK